MIVIIDPTNNLQWLPPLYSINISYNEMVLNLGDTNSVYYGFRYASSADVLSLYDAYGLVANTSSWAPPVENHEPALEFQHDFGVTRVLEGNQLNTLGIISDSSNDGSWHYAGEVTVFLELFSQQVQDGAVASTTAGIRSDYADEGWGSYLIMPISDSQIQIPQIQTPPINLKSEGLLPVTILSTGEFDATIIDPSSVQLAGATCVHHSMEDVDQDGDMDIRLMFNAADLVIDPADMEATLIAHTDSGTLVVGKVTIRMVPKNR